MPAHGDIKTVMVDDDEYILELAGREFKKAGIVNVAFFLDADEYRKQLTDEVHIAIIDHTLPGPVDGHILIEEVKDKNRENFVIGYSGTKDPNILKKYINSDTDVFVDKNDFNHMEELTKAVLEAIPITRRRAHFYGYFKTQFGNL